MCHGEQAPCVDSQQGGAGPSARCTPSLPAAQLTQVISPFATFAKGIMIALSLIRGFCRDSKDSADSRHGTWYNLDRTGLAVSAVTSVEPGLHEGRDVLGAPAPHPKQAPSQALAVPRRRRRPFFSLLLRLVPHHPAAQMLFISPILQRAPREVNC